MASADESILQHPILDSTLAKHQIPGPYTLFTTPPPPLPPPPVNALPYTPCVQDIRPVGLATLTL